MKAKILLVDDEDIFREDLAELLRAEGLQCDTAADGEQGLRAAAADPPDVVLCDLVMPGTSGLEVVQRLAALCPETSVLVITAHGTVETAVEAFRAGAVDYLLKPVLHEDLLQKIRRCLEHRRLVRELLYLRRQVAGGGEIVGRSPGIEGVRRLIDRVGPARTSVLITGESGTGKELVARALHQTCCGETAPFIAVNCAALPRELAESELFGHVRGAFTGAHRDKPGYFELAHGGTLFLDEIGDLPLEIQPKLLRAIEEQAVYRIGATRSTRVEARILAATHRDLEAETEAGRFREDLYFRIAVVQIALPPLRDRRDDIPLLIDHLLGRLNVRLDRRILGVDRAALRVLMGARWRGNIRELENVLERAMLLTEESYIGLADLPAELAGEAHCPELSDDLRRAVRAYEREHIRHVLQATGGNREEAARRLGIDASTLYRRLKELEL